MTTAELKTHVLQRIKRIDDESALRIIDSMLDFMEQPEIGSIWASLTHEQKKRVLLSYEQSFDPSKLIEWEAFSKRKG